MRIEGEPEAIARPELSGPGYRYKWGHLLLDKSDPERPVVVATDGRALVVLPATDAEGDVSGLFPAALLRHGRKVTVAGEVARVKTSADGLDVSAPCADASEFPAWRNALPKRPEKPVLLALNVEYLLQVVRALHGSTHPSVEYDEEAEEVIERQGGLNDPVVLLEIDPENTTEDGLVQGAVRLRGLNDTEEERGFGLLMPVVRG